MKKEVLKRKGGKEIFKEEMSENLPESMKDVNVQIQDAQQIPN